MYCHLVERGKVGHVSTFLCGAEKSDMCPPFCKSTATIERQRMSGRGARVIMRKQSLTSKQRQQRHQWKKKHRRSLNEDRQQDTVKRISRAVAALEGQFFPSQTQVLAALTEQCWQLDALKPGYKTFKKYEHLWIHLVVRESAKPNS